MVLVGALIWDDDPIDVYILQGDSIPQPELGCVPLYHRSTLFMIGFISITPSICHDHSFLEVHQSI